MITLEELTMQDLALIVLSQISQNPTQKGLQSDKFQIVCCDGLFGIFSLDENDENPLLLAQGPMKINKDY